MRPEGPKIFEFYFAFEFFQGPKCATNNLRRKATKNNSQGLIFVTILCQRVNRLRIKNPRVVRVRV